MCHKLVQTAVGRLHFAANMAGEEDSIGQSARALGLDQDHFWRLLVCSGAVLGMDESSSSSPLPDVFSCWCSFATKYFSWAFTGSFQICHLYYFTNSWLWIDWHFREFSLWSRNLLNLSPAAEQDFYSLNLSLNHRFVNRKLNATQTHSLSLPTYPQFQFPL